MTTYNLQSPTTGNPVPNQFAICIHDRMIFKSYDKIIAIRNSITGETMVNRDYWDYSQTTLKYFKVWLGTDMTKAKLTKHMADNYPKYSLVGDLMIINTYESLVS